MATKVGILTAGSDSPGVNAAIRGFGKAAQGSFNMEVIGFRDGYEGLVEDHATDLSAEAALSGILTLGGTILGTSLNMPQAMPSPSGPANLTQQAVDTYHRHNLDALVVIGDKRAQNAAYLLSQQGLNIVTMP